MPTNYNRANLITESATLFPDNNSQLISPADLRSWLDDGTTSFVTQKDKSTLENAIFENQGSTLAAGATVDLNTATGNYLHISGTGTINSFGTCPAGARFILMFEAAATLTYNVTSLIIPGGTNKTVVAGDCCMIVSEGSGNWRIVGYFVAAGAGSGTITGVTAGTGLSGGGTSGAVTVNLANTAVTPAAYTNANITVDAQGRITAAANGSGGGGGTVTSVSGTAPILSSGGTTPTISIPQASASVDGYLDNTDFATFAAKQDALTSGTNIKTVNSNSLLGAGNVSVGTVTSITAGTGLNGGAITSSGTIDLANTAVTPAAYTNANITVDAQGRITAASNGSGGGGSGTVTSVATAGLISGGPITTSGTVTTSMATNKLVGRYGAGTGIMQEVTIGSGLTLTGAGTLNNTATPTPLGYYGAFQDSTTQTAASINTAYAVKLNTTDLSNNVTVVNDGSGNPTRVTMANAGIYNIQFSLQLEKTGGSGNMIADIWIRKNGVDIPSTTGKVVLTGSANASPVIAAWNYVLDLSAGDYIQLMWATSNTNVEIVASTATSPHPAIPSAILTVTQQSGIMAGTGITSINSLTGAAQTLATGTSGTDFAVVSSGTSHTLNLPDASDTARGLITIGSQTLKGVKTFGNGTSAGEIRLLEPSGSGSNYVAIKSQAIGSDYSLTLPTTAGTSGYILQTDGSGSLSWTNNGGTMALQYLKNPAATSLVNPASNTILDSLLIPAGTFKNYDAFIITARVTGTAGAVTGNVTVGVNTSISLSGVVALQSNALGTSVATHSTAIGINLYGGGSGATTRFLGNPLTAQTTSGTTTTLIDWSVNQYIIYYVGSTNTPRTYTNVIICTTPV